jgi:anaerobic dimethyl sulfoxide reductase subunit A
LDLNPSSKIDSDRMTTDHTSTAEKILTTTCSYDCGGRCLLKVHISDGQIRKIGTENRAGLAIKACPRGLAQQAVAQDPSRLMQPLQRIGPRGAGAFKPITWDQALAQVATELMRVKDQHGPEAIYIPAITGSLATLHNTSRASRRFFGLLGPCTTTTGVTSFEGALQSSLATYGTPFSGSGRDTLPASRLIVLWGWDPLVSRFGPDTAPALARAKQAGAQIVCVDPRRNHTARALGARWVPIRPGTDAAMLIAMAQVMIAEGLCDDKFLATYTVGFETFADYATGRADGLAKTPAWAEAVTGVPAEVIAGLARDYATVKPAALIDGWAPGRTADGEQFHRVAATVSAMTGNVGIEGGYAAGGLNSLPLGWLRSPIPLPGTKHPKVHVTKLYDAILQGQAGGYAADCKLLYIVGSNPLNQLLNLNKGKAALLRPDFVVVQDLFLTPTARFADIVLPVSHFFEREDIGQPYGGGPYCLYMNKVTNGPPGPKSDLQIFAELAERMGLDDYMGKTESEWLEAVFATTSDLPDRETMKQKGVHRIALKQPHVAFREQIRDLDSHPFPTPSGKIEIDSQLFADRADPAISSIPTYREGPEGPQDNLAQRFPLQLVSPHSKARVNSQFDNIPQLKKMADDMLWLNTRDAEKRGIRNGETVRVFNDKGAMTVAVRVTPDIMPGVVSIDQGIWHHPDEQGVDTAGSVNVLTRDGRSPAGAFPCNSCLVEIKKDDAS